MATKQLTCPECQSPMHLRSGSFGKFYQCDRWPKCRIKQEVDEAGETTARVGTKFEKAARTAAHAWFDLLWTTGRMTQQQAYQWLQQATGKTKKQAHIGLFGVAECDSLVSTVRKFLGT